MNLLPDHLIGAYTHFRDSLHERHGLSVRPLHYLRLVLDAADLPGIPTHAGRYIVELRIQGRRVRCLYDPRGTGALVTAFWGVPVIPLYQGSKRQNSWQTERGVRRKYKNSKARRRPYRRPAPGESR